MAQKFCSATDNLHGSCKAEPKEGSKWCPRHNEQRIKLYNGYKAYHASLDAFPEDSICRNFGSIQHCSSYETVKNWSKSLRTKYTLLQRCIEARAYFTERFFGNDMDFGHKTFWHYLNKQRDEVEKLLEHVERKAYELLLASQNAMWVLDQPNDDSNLEQCSGHEDEVTPKKVSSPSLPSPAENPEDIEDPVDVALREKRKELQEKMRTRLARYLCPYESSYYMERVRVIWACVSRAIMTDPGLMLIAQNYVFVVSMLSDETLDIGMVERMWNAIKDLSVHDVRAAIDDVLHPIRPTGEYVEVLGTRVHKEMSGSSLPFHGWGHMTALFPCYSCVRRACSTVEDIVALTRYSILTASGLAQSFTKYDYRYPGSRELSLCGFIPNNIDNFGPRYKVEKCNCYYNRNTPHWTETKTNNVICAGLALSDPKAQLFVNACLRHPDFMVACRKGPNGRVIRSKTLIGTRVRKATTRAALKNTPWDPTEEVFFQDSVLEEACPVVAPDVQLEDCFQIVIVDDGEGEVEDFVDKLVKVWYQIYGVDSFRGLISEIGNPYLDCGELELEMDRLSMNTNPIIPNLEFNIQKSYMRLWARSPDEGRLADDEIDIEIVPGRQVAIISNSSRFQTR